eukprot:5635886-Prymnesium_polylepis.1
MAVARDVAQWGDAHAGMRVRASACTRVQPQTRAERARVGCTGKAAVKYSDEQDLGWKARAVFELSAEAAVRKMMGVEKPPKTKAPPPEEKKGPFGGLFGR